MRATYRARKGRSRVGDGLASAVQAAFPRRRGRSERRRSGPRPWQAPARAWRGEGFGSRPQAATQRTQQWDFALEERQLHFSQAFATQKHIQTGMEEPLTSRDPDGKLCDRLASR